MTGLSVRELGEYIREQRDAAQVSLRQLAKIAGVSNPYLSQIERGLRKPSAEILQQIAKALRISAETLYVRAGILDDDKGGEKDDEHGDDGAVVAALRADSFLTSRQKRVLLDIYESFRNENAAARETGPESPAAKEPEQPEQPESAGRAEQAERAERADKPEQPAQSS